MNPESSGRRDKRLRRLAEVIEDANQRTPRERGHLVPQLRGRHGPLWGAQGRLDSGLEPVSPRQAGLRLQQARVRLDTYIRREPASVWVDSSEVPGTRGSVQQGERH